MSRLSRTLGSVAFALATSFAGTSLLGCHPAAPVAPLGSNAQGSSKAFVAAFHAEMRDPLAAQGYLDAIQYAAENPGDPHALATTVASLDVLVDGGVGFGLAYRSRENFQRIAIALREAWTTLEGASAVSAPFQRMLLARALAGMATFTGEQGGATVWRSRRGCAAGATVIGPLDLAPLTALEGPSKTPGTGPLPPAYESPNVFVQAATSNVTAADCSVETGGASDKPGLREVIFHVENPKDQRLSLMLTAGSAWSLEVAGSKLMERRFDTDWGTSTALGHVQVTSGLTRIVLRLADRGDGGPVELMVLDQNGLPLQPQAASSNDAATSLASNPAELPLLTKSVKEDDIIVSAAALMAVGDARRSEHLLEAALLAQRENRPPALHLLFMRSMDRASDMADWAKTERMKASIDIVRKAEPTSWEAKNAAANMSQRRKGFSDGGFEALVELGIRKPDSDLSALNVMELNLALSLAQQANMNDLAERIFSELAKKAPGAPMTASIESSLHQRSGKEWLAVACEGGLSRASTVCGEARLSQGDKRGALEEYARLRKLLNSPDAYRSAEVNILQQLGQDKEAISLYFSLPRWKRSLTSILPALVRMPDREAGRALAMKELIDDRSREYTIQTVELAFSEPSEDAKRFEEAGKKLVEVDKKQNALPGAATAVLKHVEHYGMDEDGLTKVIIYDLRRIGGTTDVDRTMFVDQPTVDGRGYVRPLRRRVHKVDGRVLEADVAGGGLSQLEKGDYVEHYLEGYYRPNELGEITVDTPDLLPERTSVADAEVVLRLPQSFKPAFWTHPLLGKPIEETKGNYRFLSFKLKDREARRMEDGLPFLERGVRVSFGTQTWDKVGRAVGENMRGLIDRDPFIARFAEEAVQGSEESPDEAATVRRVVEHVGKTVKVASGGGEFADFAGFSGGGGRGMAMRAIVEEGTGSRTFVLLTTLRELGIDADVAVSEVEPFSAAPNFPPHPGRFQKPLVVAHLESGDLWIDSDVSGPPLPPGRVSPELRGRQAILSDGEIVPVPVQAETAIDTVALDLTLDPTGTAKGKVSIVLRSREAQSLAESFNYVVGSDRTNMLRSVVASWLPWASIDDVQLVSKEGAWEVELAATVTIPGFGSVDTKDGKTWVIPGYEPARAGTLASIWGTKIERDSSLNIDMPIQYQLTRTVTLPSGAKVEKLPAGVDQKSGFVQAKRSLSNEGGKLIETFTMNVTTGTVDLADYRAFLKDVRTVDSGFLSGVRVRVKD